MLKIKPKYDPMLHTVLLSRSSVQLKFYSFLQRRDHCVAIKVITKKNLSKAQNLLTKEINILKVSRCFFFHLQYKVTAADSVLIMGQYHALITSTYTEFLIFINFGVIACFPA